MFGRLWKGSKLMKPAWKYRLLSEQKNYGAITGMVICTYHLQLVLVAVFRSLVSTRGSCSDVIMNAWAHVVTVL